MNYYRNPLLDKDAPDPFMTYDPVTGYYYALHTNYNKVEIFRSKTAFDILKSESKIVYTSDNNDGNYNSFWAPEMHKAPDGRWYIYTSAMIIPDGWCPRIFVLGSKTNDPFGEWEYKGRPFMDEFSIDPTVYTDKNGKQYMCCSKVQKPDGQVLVITELKNPYTPGEKSAVIAKAEYDWELVPPYGKGWAINEGPFFVEKDGRLYIIYSGNGCWSKDYCLAVLEYVGGDMCDKNSWVKHDKPVFTHGNGVFGPGHASFFKSPDNSELWCVYHVLKDENPSNKCAPRYFCIQPFYFDENSFPKYQHPVGFDKELKAPSGEDKI